jgi:hypothetical protein
VKIPLTPLASGLEGCLAETHSPRRPFALIDRARLTATARVMPDAQSAVLACLLWQACKQERLARGPLAGRFVARLSGPRLATLTGRPLRTVRYALRRLSDSGVIRREAGPAGTTAIYALQLKEGS